MFGALDVGLLDLDHHPPIRPSLAVLRQLGQHILGQLVGKGFELVALRDARLAIDMQADGISIEVEDQQGDVRIFRNVPQTGKYAVAAVFRVEEMLAPQHMDEAGLAESRAAIAFAVTIGGADEHELLPGDEFPHPRGEKIQDLPGIKRYWPDPRRHISPAARARRRSRAGGSGFSALPDHRAGPAGGQPRKAADYFLGCPPKILDAGSYLSHLEQPPIEQGGGLRCRCNQLNAQPSAARTTHALCIVMRKRFDSQSAGASGSLS